MTNNNIEIRSRGYDVQADYAINPREREKRKSDSLCNWIRPEGAVTLDKALGNGLWKNDTFYLVVLVNLALQQETLHGAREITFLFGSDSSEDVY